MHPITNPLADDILVFRFKEGPARCALLSRVMSGDRGILVAINAGGGTVADGF